VWSAHGVAVTGLSFSPNGQYLASCGADYLVRVWPFGGDKVLPQSWGSNPITLSGHNAPLSGVAFRKDSQHLVSCGGDMTVKLWKLEKGGAKESQTYRGHKDWVTGVAFSRDGYFVASSSVDRTVKIWEITSREIPLLAEHTGSVYAVAVSPNGKLIASGGTDKTIKLWDREQGTEMRTLHGHTDAIHSLAFTPDGKTLISSSEDRSLKLWDVATGNELPRQPGHQQFFQGLINPVPYFTVPTDKKLLAWVPGNERSTTLTGLDIASGNELFAFEDGSREKPRHVVAVSFSGDGKLAATGAKDGSVRFWDLDKKKQAGEDWIAFAKGTSLGDLALTPDGAVLVIAGDQGDVKILDVAKRTAIHTISNAHTRKIVACLVSPDGKRFATVGQDNAIKLFDIAGGPELRRWDLHVAVQDRGTFVVNLAFTPDNRYLVTANANTSLFVLELP
jgi:WD40 repeat protein